MNRDFRELKENYTNSGQDLLQILERIQVSLYPLTKELVSCYCQKMKWL
jgi:hypothetical protein